MRNKYKYRYKDSGRRKEMARNLLSEGYKQDYVSLMTGYSQQEVSRIKRQMEQDDEET